MNDRRRCKGIGAYHSFIILLLILMALSSSASAADTMFRANPEHTGVFDNGGIVQTNTELWHFKTWFYVQSSPVVSNRLVYVGSYDGYLYAINALSGTEKWRFKMGGFMWSSPAVSNGVIYVGSFDNNLYAINALSGTEKWRFTTGDAVSSSPAVSNGVVYVGSYDDNLYAIDAVTGKEKWRFKTGSNVRSSPAVSNGVVYVGSLDDNLYAIDAVTGTEKWRFETGDEVWSSPAVSNNVVYIGSDDNILYAIDAVTGTMTWWFKTGGEVSSSPAVSNNAVYIGSDDNILYAIDVVRGKEIWRFSTGGNVESSPALSSGVVYVGSGDNNTYAIDAVTGEEKWRFETGDAVWSSPAVANGVVYFGSRDNNLYAVGEMSSNPITTLTIDSNSEIQSAPPSLSPSNNGDSNFILPIIVIPIVLFLALGGGYYVLRSWKPRKEFSPTVQDQDQDFSNSVENPFPLPQESIIQGVSISQKNLDLIFISSKSEDFDQTQQLYTFLKDRGYNVFFSQLSLPDMGSSDYRKEIDRALDLSKHMIVVTSKKEYVEAPWVEAEWGLFINEKRSGRKLGNIITLIIDAMKIEDLPSSLRYYEVIPFDSKSFEKILKYLK